MQKVLFEEKKLPVQKRTGIKNEPSTDQESLERLAALGHVLPKTLIEYRKLIKLKNTYVDVLPVLADTDGRVHTSFNQASVETGRLSSSDPNLQNIPARTEQGAQLRKAFIPREGWTLVTADYSQIELLPCSPHFCGDRDAERGVRGGPRRSRGGRGADLQGERSGRDEGATRDGEDGSTSASCTG